MTQGAGDSSAGAEWNQVCTAETPVINALAHSSHAVACILLHAYCRRVGQLAS
jgi:hypothetical protein